MNPQDRDALEALVDRTNLSSVLEALGNICADKSQHLQENWQERKGSQPERFWRVWGGRLHQESYAAEKSERELKIYRGTA